MATVGWLAGRAKFSSTPRLNAHASTAFEAKSAQ
jgi:hypothetical protein